MVGLVHSLKNKKEVFMNVNDLANIGVQGVQTR